ncbi:MAG: cyclic nucleotide-binding domain-containing protein [Coraliomargarita sp.]|nr:cyclic nucleotide-binding domain-containing protein [Coraliomargarita sp.]
MLKKFVSSVIQSKKTKGIEDQLKTKLLSKVPFLQGADDELIQDLASALVTSSVAQDETIFNEGDQGDSLFLIVDGSVSVVSKGEEIAKLGVGGCFGEGALIRQEARGATVIAIEAVTLLELKRESFDELTEKYRKVRLRLRQLHERRKAEDIGKSIERNLLSNAPFLSGAGADLINELAVYLERKKYAEGETIIKEGEEGKSMFLVENGTVGVSKSGSQVAELGPGACIGEGALFSRKPRSASVTALSETSCLFLSKGAFDRIIGRYPVFGKKLRAIHTDRS